MANRKNRSQLKFNQMLNKIAFNRNAFRKFNFNCKSIDVKFRQKFVLELEEKNRSSLVWICCSRRWYNLRAELCWVRGLFVRMLLPLFSHSYTRKRWKCEWNSITWWLPLHSIQRQQTQRQISNKLAHTLAHQLTHVRACVQSLFVSFLGADWRGLLTHSLMLLLLLPLLLPRCERFQRSSNTQFFFFSLLFHVCSTESSNDSMCL